MKFLIIGYDGLIGSEITRRFDEVGADWVGIEKQNQIKRLKIKNFDCIIHLGANCIIRDVIKDPKLAEENMKINFDVMEFARINKIPKVVYFSSSRVMSGTMNPYVASKMQGENLCRAYFECYGIEYLIVRPETVWSMEDKHNRVITNWINAAKKNEDIVIYGDYNKILSPIHVDSFVESFFNFLYLFVEVGIPNKSVGISGKSLLAIKIIDMIKYKFKSSSRIIFADAEQTQPQGEILQTIRVDDFRNYLEQIE